MQSQHSKRPMYVLFAVLAVETVLSLAGNLDEAVSFRDGHRGVSESIAVAALIWLPIVLMVIGWIAASLTNARRDLHSREQALAAVAETSSDWLWEADTEHRLTYSSAGVEQLLGYRPEEVLGHTSKSLMPEREWTAADQLMRQSLASGVGWDGVEITWQHADGSLVVLHGTAAAIKNQHGQVVGFRGTRRAIRPAEVAERALAAARTRLRDLLSAGSLDIALQPIIDFNTGAVCGAEALARFRDGRSPDVWFRDAADVGLALDLDLLAFRSALRLFSRLPTNCYLSVNASPELVLSGLLTSELINAPTSVPLDRLVLEITEHAQVASYPDLQAVLSPLREHGVRIAVDDTGAGYASLNHVLQLHPSIIKLDRSLIADLADDRARRSLVTALVLLALDLGATTTGEGIETVSELETLRVLGVDSGQGYFLGRPSTDELQWARWWSREWLTAITVAGTNADSPHGAVTV